MDSITTVYLQLQTDLKQAGFYTGALDGRWGPASHGAFVQARKGNRDGLATLLGAYCQAIAWSAKVSQAFAVKVKVISSLLGVSPDELMACMAFETGETFSPTIKNAAGAPYYGLIQFGAAAAADVGATIPSLLKMSAEQQLEYVYRFFKPYSGKLRNLNALYMKILWPAAVEKPDDYVLFIKDDGTKRYIQNKGLDLNMDGKITKGEACAKVQDKLVRGLDPVNLKVA